MSINMNGEVYQLVKRHRAEVDSLTKERDTWRDLANQWELMARLLAHGLEQEQTSDRKELTVNVRVPELEKVKEHLEWMRKHLRAIRHEGV